MIQMQAELAAHDMLFLPKRLTIKILNFCAAKDTLKKIKRYPQNGRKILEIIYLKRGLYLKYIKIYYNSIIEKQMTQLKK